MSTYLHDPVIEFDHLADRHADLSCRLGNLMAERAEQVNAGQVTHVLLVRLAEVRAEFEMVESRMASLYENHAEVREVFGGYPLGLA